MDQLRIQRGELPPTEVIGAPRRPVSDLFYHLMNAAWWQVIAASAAGYVAAIGAFAVAFRLGGDCISGARPGSWTDAFWFSVQTFSTIGYGGMSPATPWANVLVTVESWFGLAGVAVTTALLYAKFARPRARVAFADSAVIAHRHGRPTLQIRMANERKSAILDAKIEVAVLVEDVTPEGQHLNRLIPLPLERDHLHAFRATMTAIHDIEDDGPLQGLLEGSDDPGIRFLLIAFSGSDATLMQQVHARYIYAPDQIQVGYTFDDMVEASPTGQVRVHLDRLHAVSPEPTPETPLALVERPAEVSPAAWAFAGERRAEMRYTLDPPMNVQFGQIGSMEASDGQIADLSEGGVRIVASADCRTMLRWGDAVQVTLGGEDTTSVGGVSLCGRVVRIVSDERATVLQVGFDRTDDAWEQLRAWVHTLSEATALV